MARLPAQRPRLGALDTRTARAMPKQAAAHYLTPEHRAWRTAVLARAGGCCQACARSGVRLFADHVVEMQDGGAPLDLSNGQALCGACHTRKTAAARAARQASRP